MQMDLHLPLRISRIHLTLVLAAAFSGAAGIWLSSQSLQVIGLLVVVWLAALFWALSIWRSSPDHIKLLDSIAALEISGHQVSRDSARILPFLVYFPGQAGHPALLIWCDALSGEHWRQLRMWLKIRSV